MIDVQNIIKNPDKVASLKEKEIEECLDKVRPLFEKEKALIKVEGKTTFMGDTHGDFEAAKAVVKKFFDKTHLVFLGDYIDRAPINWGSLYNMVYLLILKGCYPDKLSVLKGNHECNYLIPCYPYKFKDEIIQKFGSSKLHDKFVTVFSSMPLMFLGNNVFGAHGGILKGFDLKQLRMIGKNDVNAIESLVWSAPVDPLTFRGAGDRFDKDDLTRFLQNINASVFIRGHDYNTLGFSIFEGKCLTIFSSRGYKYLGNGGILVAKAEKEISRVQDLVVEDFSTGK